tara:strand:+ start:266 stop:1417 length:1152 start_codon:yes stop_codon:yes gene_type:complete
MNICHITGYFVEGLGYQENLLPKGQSELGHKVTILTGRWEPDFGFNSKERLHKKETFTSQGVEVRRLNDWYEIKNKGPFLKGIIKELKKIKPDIIFIHDIGLSLLWAIIYKRFFDKNVFLQFDCHSTPGKAMNSKIGPLYHYFFRFIFSFNSSLFVDFFAIAPEAVAFISDIYKIPKRKISLLPLPGDASLLTKKEIFRESFRKEYKLPKDSLLIVHSGKFNKEKRTIESIKAFKKVNKKNVFLLIAGFSEGQYSLEISKLIKNNKNIINLGWVSTAKLREVLISADIMLQPGSLSNTFIEGVCSGLFLILDNTAQGRYLTKWGNGKIINKPTTKKIAKVLDFSLELLTNKSFEGNEKIIFAAKELDYRNNAKISLENIISKK